MQTEAIIFDRDNTLVYFDADSLHRIEAQVAAIAPELPATVAMSAWATWPGPWPQHPADEPFFWRTFWSSIGNQYNLPPTVTAALTEHIGAIYHTCFTAYPESAAIVGHLHKCGLRLAVLTNFELPSVDRTLLHAGINPDLFDVTLTSSGLGLYKPDPRAFLAAAHALRLPPSACLFVDDLAENVAVARSTGMRAYQIDRSLRADELDSGQICSLASLLEIVLPPS